MESVTGFKEVAPYLTHPLVLVGFVLLLVFGVQHALLKAGIVPPLSARAGGKIVTSILRYGFIIALLVILLGFAFVFYQTRAEHDPTFQKGELDKKRIDGLIQMATSGFCQSPEKFEVDATTRRDVVIACTKAVAAIVNAVDVPQAKIEDAITRLAKNDSQNAKVIARQVLSRKVAEGQSANRDAAEWARHLGALAYYNDTGEALSAYRQAVALTPGDPEGWNELGHLLSRTGQLNDAETAYRNVIAIPEARNSQAMLAVAYSGLGDLYVRRGDLDQAEKMYKKAVEIDEAIGSKEGLAAYYGSLGNVYRIRDDLAQAELMFKKSLEIYETLSDREGMATNYNNLGGVYEIQRDLLQAEVMFKKALEINTVLGHKEGMADAYGNLGNVYQLSKDLPRAEEMHKKAMEIDEVLGRKAGLAENYSNLGNVYQARGDLDEAEKMYKKALATNQILSRKEGMAINSANLGIVYEKRGDLGLSKTMFQKAHGIYNEIGAIDQAQKMQEWIASIEAPQIPKTEP